jgi:non-canonical poly(A) RNA polymerase PAPD5/7
VQEVYDKKVIHRLVGVQPKTTVMQDDPQLSSTVNSKGGGASIIQSIWEPAERCEDTENEGHARKRRSATIGLSREVIDVDADEEEGRYEITRRKGRGTKEVIDVETFFTTDEESEDEVGVGGSRSNGGEGEQVPVKINRKRAFWASKAGTAAAGLGT